MNTYVALLRGINVGGKNRLPMAELVAVLERLDLSHIKTYIQSGNAVFQSKDDGIDLAPAISAAIETSAGLNVQVVVLSRAELEGAIAANPFPEAKATPTTLHLFFLASVPQDPDLKALEKTQKDSEQFRLIDRVFYLHTPDGIGRSKLAAKVEAMLGVATTARNWNTVMKLADMVK